MLSDLWPTYQLRITTPRVQLRLPDERDIAELASLAAEGVHLPSERPFLTPWTDGTPAEIADIVLRWHWGRLAEWAVDDWNLGLGVFAASGEPLGMVTLRAKNFRVVREVTTSSWLGLRHQGKGIGTEARRGVLALAFDHLDAEAALTEVFQDNHASQGVSRTLGYQPDGISRDARGSEAVVSDRLRLTRSRWGDAQRAGIVVEGIDASRHLFGA